MASYANMIRLGGMNSGLDTQAIVDAMTANTKLRKTKLQRNVKKVSAQQEAYQDIISKLKTFKGKYMDILNMQTYLKSPSTFGKKAIDLGGATLPKGVTITAGSDAQEGNYSVSISAKATQTTVQGKNANSGGKLDDFAAIANGTASHLTDESFSVDVTVNGVKKTVDFTVGATEQDTINNLNNALKAKFGSANNGSGLVKFDGTAANGTIISASGYDVKVAATAQMKDEVSLGNIGAINKTGSNTFVLHVNGESKSVTVNTVKADYFADLFNTDGSLKANADKAKLTLFKQSLESAYFDQFADEIKAGFDQWKTDLAGMSDADKTAAEDALFNAYFDYVDGTKNKTAAQDKYYTALKTAAYDKAKEAAYRAEKSITGDLTDTQKTELKTWAWKVDASDPLAESVWKKAGYADFAAYKDDKALAAYKKTTEGKNYDPASATGEQIAAFENYRDNTFELPQVTVTTSNWNWEDNGGFKNYAEMESNTDPAKAAFVDKNGNSVSTSDAIQAFEDNYAGKEDADDHQFLLDKGYLAADWDSEANLIAAGHLKAEDAGNTTKVEQAKDKAIKAAQKEFYDAYGMTDYYGLDKDAYKTLNWDDKAKEAAYARFVFGNNAGLTAEGKKAQPGDAIVPGTDYDGAPPYSVGEFISIITDGLMPAELKSQFGAAALNALSVKNTLETVKFGDTTVKVDVNWLGAGADLNNPMTWSGVGAGEIKVSASHPGAAAGDPAVTDKIGINLGEKTVNSFGGLNMDAAKSVSKIALSTKLGDLGLTFTPNSLTTGQPLTDDNGNRVVEPFPAYEFKINGVAFKFTKDQSIDAVIKAVNASKAGVNMSYSSITGKFSVTSTAYGADGEVSLEDGTQGLLDRIGLVGAGVTTTQGKNMGLDITSENGTQHIEVAGNSYSADGISVSVDKSAVIDPHNPTVIEFGVKKDTSYAVNALKEFVKDYNQLLTDVYGMLDEKPAKDYYFLADDDASDLGLTEKQTEDWEKASKKGLLYGDSTVDGVMSRIRTAMFMGVDNLSGGSTKFNLFSITDSLGNHAFGTSSDYKEHSKLTLDEKALEAALSDSTTLDQIISLFTSKDGIMQKLSDAIDYGIKSTGTRGTRGVLVEKAGLATGTSATTNSMYDQLKSMTEMIESLNKKYESEQTRYWKKFSQLETAMGKLNQQTSTISQYLGYATSGNS